MKKIIVIFLSIALIVIVTLSIIKSSPEKITVCTMKKSYNGLVDEEGEKTLTVRLMFDYKDSYYNYKENVLSVNFEDKETRDIIDLSLIKIEYYDEVIIDKEIFYAYDYYVQVNFQNINQLSFCFKKALFTLDYDEIIMQIDIGSVYLEKTNDLYSDDSKISIKNLNGIKNEVNNIPTLVSIILKLENKTEEKQTITSIEIIDANLGCNMDYSKVIDENSIDNSDDIIKFLNNDYHYQVDEKSSCNITILPNEELVIAVPLCNFMSYSIKKVGFKIKYILNGNEYSYSYPPFLFFNSFGYTKEEINSIEFNIYEFN